MRRESAFPLHLIETGYSKIRIQDAEASVPDDKTRILDSIAANAADREDAFDRVNRELRAMLAEPALNQSAQKGSLQKAMDVLCADTHRTKVTVDLSSCSELSDFTPLGALAHLPNLNQLTLILSGCGQLSDLTPLGALAHLQNLNQLTLELSYCSELSDLTPLRALEHLQNLNQLTLDLRWCDQLSEDSARTQLKGLIDLHPHAVEF